MHQTTLRMTIDLPLELHDRLRALAVERGCTLEAMILDSVENLVNANRQDRPNRRLSLDIPLVPLTGRPITLNEDEIYSGTEFP